MDGVQNKVLQICHGEGTIKVDEVKIVENGIQVDGVVELRILYIITDDEMPFYSMESAIPFTHVIEAPGISGDCRYYLRTDLEQLSTTMIDSNEIEVKAVINLNAVVLARQEEEIIDEIREHGNTTLNTRQKLAGKVFNHTAAYDAMIANYFNQINEIKIPEKLTVTYDLKQSLRYGENPHQSAAFYQTLEKPSYSVVASEQLHGKELSYNNIADANAALEILAEFEAPAAVAVKHMNPCGIGIGSTIEEAYAKAYEADSTSIFGGIVALNREVSKEVATELHKIFLEIIIAPSFTEEALQILKQKKNIRLLTTDMSNRRQLGHKLTTVKGGLLQQDLDTLEVTLEDLECVTEVKPTQEDLEQLLFGFKVVKHVKSNAIALVKDNMTVGVGAGQMNRVGAAKIALEQANELASGSYLASDAFFPMSDTVELAAKYGVKAIIQPGGSIKDQDSIDACNKFGIAMVFTKVRHFKH